MNKLLLPLVAAGVLGIGIIVGYLIFNNKNSRPADAELTNVKQESSVDFKKEEVPEKPKPVIKPEPEKEKTDEEIYPEYDGWDNGDDVTYDYYYPGDKVYIYGVKNGEWFAKNTRTQKTFNINRNPKFKSSVKKLDELYPYAKMP